MYLDDNTGRVYSAKDDAKLIVVFFIKPVKNEFKSNAEGRDIFDPIEFIKIVIPGERDEVERKATKDDIKRFKDRYATWKEKGEQVQSGTPLEQWTMLSVQKVAELKAMKIYTLENLVDLPDGKIQFIGMGGRELIKKAKDFIEAAKGSGVLAQLRDENTALLKRLEALEKLMADKPIKAPTVKINKAKIINESH